MNEKHVIQCVRKATKNLFNKYVILAVMLCSYGLASAQNSDGIISGKVLSEKDGEPLIGVSIMVKGSKVGTVTDLNGAFTLQTKTGETLSVSYVGYLSQTVKVTGSDLTIKLSEDAKGLDEVVVIGYGVQKKKLNTGANLQVKGEEIAKMNTTNPLLALQGKTPGMSISSTSGQPGSDLKVTIRGLGTIGNSQPLYIIDGVEGDVTTLNASDIQSIDVLKDAASAAIYGSQAANGVVLVTTKQGTQGKAQVTFDAYYGVQNVERKIPLLNAQEYKMIMDEQQIGRA